jgi:hypothetical protein
MDALLVADVQQGSIPESDKVSWEMASAEV